MRLAHPWLMEEHAPGAKQCAVIARRRKGVEAVRNLLAVAIVQGALLRGKLFGR